MMCVIYILKLSSENHINYKIAPLKKIRLRSFLHLYHFTSTMSAVFYNGISSSFEVREAAL